MNIKKKDDYMTVEIGNRQFIQALKKDKFGVLKAEFDKQMRPVFAIRGGGRATYEELRGRGT